MSVDADLVVVGGGLVGLAVAAEAAAQHPTWSIALLDKEPGPATHQSGRNSGVIHSGIYYRPGSDKARLVARGRTLLEQFCTDEAVPWRRCGKVIVATSVPEMSRLATLDRLATEHGIETHRLDQQELRAHEPHAAGLAALHLPATGVVDYRAVADALRRRCEHAGVTFRWSTPVTHISPGSDATDPRRGVTTAKRRTADATERAATAHPAEHRDDRAVVHTPGGPITARRVVNCAGLHADRLAEPDPNLAIVAFRGEFHTLRPEASHLVRSLIYPVPDPAFPFLGVHLTRTIDDHVHVGPNAVLALAREGYRWRDVDRRDLAELLAFPGLWRLAARHRRAGLAELAGSLSQRVLVRRVQRLVPEIGAADLVPAPAGVRAQALGRDGALLNDFEFRRTGPVLHVLNAPSPAATACLAIGEQITRAL